MGDPNTYKKKDTVEKYDQARFETSNWRQKYFDIFERGCVTKWLKPGNILDVGCGTARFGFLSDYTGIDFSEPMIEKARDKYPDNDYQVGDAKDLPFDNGSFANVISTRVIMHVDDWQQILQEMHRVCKPGGRIVFDIKPPGVMSLLLRWRGKTLDKDDLYLNIISPDRIKEDYNVVDEANFPWIFPMTKFLVIEKQD